jgi:uncharacterized ion transporter superfamily protein YfcC
MSSSSPVRLATILGIVAFFATPIGVIYAQEIGGITLLQGTEGGVAIAVVCALASVAFVRRARFRLAWSVREENLRAARMAALLAWAGVYAAVTGGIALGAYALLAASS